MSIELDLILMSFSVLALGLFSGACTAVEILSISLLDRTAGHTDRLMVRLLNDPLNTGLAVGMARALALAITVVSSIRVGEEHLFGQAHHGSLLTGFFTLAALFVPMLISRILAMRGAERFLAAAGFVVYPVVFALRPVAVGAGILMKKMSPSLLDLLIFQLIPLKQKIEIFGTQNGEPADDEQKLVSSVLDFGETKVREIMVPRIDIVAINLGMDEGEAVETILEAGHSRVPLYDDTIDNIIGTIYTKDLLRKIVDGEKFSLAEIARETFFVPESKMIDDLLAEFKTRKQHLAVVVDEYGGTAGIITLEDVLEEIVGDIQDEFDYEEDLIERIDEDSAVCNAKVRLEEMNEVLGTRLPEDGPDSLGGLLYREFGNVPGVGEIRRLGPLTFEIRSVERQRIDKVLVSGLSSLAGGPEIDIG